MKNDDAAGKASQPTVLVDRDMFVLQLVIACEQEGRNPTSAQIAQILSHQSPPLQMNQARVMSAVTSLRQPAVGHLEWRHDLPLTSTEMGQLAAKDVPLVAGFEELVKQLLACIKASRRLTRPQVRRRTSTSGETA